VFDRRVERRHNEAVDPLTFVVNLESRRTRSAWNTEMELALGATMLTPAPETASKPTISEVTRRGIFDWITLENLHWSGRLDDVDFLARIFDLANLPSTDGRFKDAAGDIWQHRINNGDWSDDWVFTDSRFGLLTGPDDTFLKFLRETVHPIVRSDVDEARKLVQLYNDHLKSDGWELFQASTISGRPVYDARRTDIGGQHAIRSMNRLLDVFDADHLRQQVQRMDTAIETDPDLAIGTAKELIETICKGILQQRGENIESGWDVPQLTKATVRTLGLVPEGISDATKGAETIRVLLSGLASVAGRLAELRNLYGTGHGKSPNTKGLQPRHARLAAGAAAILATFLFETHLARPKQPGPA
jgi:hypothetical protein